MYCTTTTLQFAQYAEFSCMVTNKFSCTYGKATKQQIRTYALYNYIVLAKVSLNSKHKENTLQFFTALFSA